MSTHNASPLGKLRGVILICCLVLILGILGCAYLSDKYNTVLNKDEIISKIESSVEDDTNYSYISSYIKRYGIGNINVYKINEAETKIRNNFYKELPDRQELAKTIVSLFVEKYYDTVDHNDKTAVTDAVLNCFIEAIGDPYAFYRTPKQYEDYNQSLEGGEDFVGIGVQINSETHEITMVYKESGAYEAGIRPKDIFYGVDDKTTDNTSLSELLDMIKGEAGTVVKIKVKRNGEVLEFDVTRKVLSTRTVTYEILEDNVGYIYISQFLGTTSAEFIEAIDYCTEMNVTSLIIDVRYNPGGLLVTAIEVIDYIIPDAEGRRLGSYSTNTSEQVFYTTDGHGVDVPIVVICNEYSASASELFTGAVRDYASDGVINAVIVGHTTFGKGIAQNSYYLHDGSALTFTIGYFNPPCNVNFHGEGVHPDLVVEESTEYDAPLEAAKQQATKLATSEPTTAEYFLFAA